MKKVISKLLVPINRLIPKHGVNHRVLVFCDMGIGDLVMLLPTLSELHECGFELVYHTTKPVIKTILQSHLPWKDYFREPRCSYGWSLNNFHTVYYREILCIMRNRIPNRVAHKHYLYSAFFNKNIAFAKNSTMWQPLQNMQLCDQFGVAVVEPKLFFYTYPPIHTGAIVIQPFSYTDARKECMDWQTIANEHPKDMVVVIGHKKEYREMPVNVFNMIGELNIFEAAGLIKAAKHFYSLESGLAHIAAAVGANTTVYYKKSITREHCLHRHLKHMEYIEIP